MGLGKGPVGRYAMRYFRSYLGIETDIKAFNLLQVPYKNIQRIPCENPPFYFLAPARALRDLMRSVAYLVILTKSIYSTYGHNKALIC